MNYLGYPINSNNQGDKTSYVVTTQHFQYPAQFNPLRQDLGPNVLLINTSPDLKIEYSRIQRYLNLAFGLVNDIYFVSIRLIKEEYDDVVAIEITNEDRDMYYLNISGIFSEYVFGKLHPHKTQIYRSDTMVKTKRQTVISNVPALGFYKAQDIGCKVCIYHDPTEVISCSIYPKKIFENVFGCPDYVKN